MEGRFWQPSHPSVRVHHQIPLREKQATTLTQLGGFLAHVVTVLLRVLVVWWRACVQHPSAARDLEAWRSPSCDDFGTSGIDCSAVWVDGEVFGSIGPTAMLV